MNDRPNEPMIPLELVPFHGEVVKRGILNSAKECASLLNSTQIEGLDGPLLNYSEIPLCSYVRALYLQGNYIEIIELTKSEYEADPVLSYFYIQSLIKSQGKISSNFSNIIECIDKKSSDIFLQFCLAQIYLQQEEYDLAFKQSILILQNSPYFWDVWLILVSSIRDKNQIAIAFDIISKENSPMSLHAALLLHIRVRNSETRNFFLAAETCLQQKLSIRNLYVENIIMKFNIVEFDIKKPLLANNSSVLVQISDIYSDFLYVNSKKDELANFAKYIAEIKGWTKESCYVIGNLYSILQQHEKALVWLRRALIIDPNYEAALIVSGNEYIELKSPGEAISAFLSASKLNPLNYRIFFSLGSVYYLLDDLDQSIYYLKLSIKLETTDFRPFELLSECFQSLGLPEHAIDYMLSALKCCGSPFILFKKLALSYISIGNLKGYLESYTKYFDQFLSCDRNENMLISDDNDYNAASKICSDNQFMPDTSLKQQLSRALLCYKRIREMVVFDYSELQMMIKTITGSDDSQLNKDKVQKVIVSTYENSKNCEEIFSVISERFSSKRSTINNILKTLDLLEILLVRGSEQFISIATTDKETLKKLIFHKNLKVKQKAEATLQLETDRNGLFARRDKLHLRNQETRNYDFGDCSDENLNFN